MIAQFWCLTSSTEQRADASSGPLSRSARLRQRIRDGFGPAVDDERRGRVVNVPKQPSEAVIAFCSGPSTMRPAE